MNRALAAAAPNSFPAPASAALLCRIDPEDVEAMLDAYDSGMCDTSTANCISRAISRLLSRDHAFPLIRHTDDLGDIEIEGHRVPVPRELLHWLKSAELGGQSGPIEFALSLPEPLIRQADQEMPAVSRRKRPAMPDGRPLSHHSPRAIA